MWSDHLFTTTNVDNGQEEMVSRAVAAVTPHRRTVISFIVMPVNLITFAYDYH
jgi:hypothetical protein